MAINNVVGTPVFPDMVGVGGILDAGEAAQYVLNRTASTYPSYPAYPTGNDANIASVALLCHCNQPGAGGAAFRIVSSVGAQGALQVPNGGSAGNTMQSGLTTTQSKWGGVSLLLQGQTAGQGLRFVQLASELTFGTGDFTIEYWWYMTTGNANQNMFDPRTTGTQLLPLIYLDASSKLRYFVNGADRITGGTAVSQNAWHFIALSKLSGSTYLYLDGAQEGSTYTDGNNYISSTNWYFSGQVIGGSNGSGAAGFWQDIRITKGVGRYSGATCTVPTTPFPDY